MRLPKGKSNTREVAFKADKCIEEKEGTFSCSDEEEAKFVRRLDRGTGKYKGKLPFKCFNYCRVWHYASKFPHKKIENQSKGKENINFNNSHKWNRFNRTFYAQQDSSACERSDESPNE